MKAILSVHALVFKNNQVLLVRHGKGAGHLTGVYGIPGGRINENENFINTATRELKEETGLIVEKSDLREFPNNQYTALIKRKDGTTKKFTMTVFFTFRFSGKLKKSSETTPQWMRISDLSKLNLLPNVKKAILNAKKFLEKPKISMIAGIGENRELGKNNRLLWHIPEDMKRFKKLTQGHVVIMGRKTFESIGKPLANRINIIVTKDKTLSEYVSINQLIDTFVAHSIEEAIDLANEKESHFAEVSRVKKASRDKEIFIIGGGQIYQQAMKYADKLYLTIVKGNFKGDVFFPDYSEFKKVVSKKENQDKNYRYTFLELEK